MVLGWTFQPILGNTKFLKMKYLTGKEGRRDCTLLYYCVQSSDYLRCVDILNHKITPLIRLLIIQNYPMKKQTLSQEFRQNNIKSLRKLVNHHSPICINIHLIYLFSLEGKSSRLSSILFILYLFVICYKTLNWIITISFTTFSYPLHSNRRAVILMYTWTRIILASTWTIQSWRNSPRNHYSLWTFLAF